MWPRKRPRSAAPAPAVRKWRAALEEEEYDTAISNDEASSEASAGDSARVAEAGMLAAAQAQLDEQEDSDEQEDAGTVDLLPELARWCRRSCREGGAAAAFVSQVMREVGTSHPRRVLLALGAKAEGRGFLLGCAEEYEVALRAASTRIERARLSAALGSVHEALGDVPAAVARLRCALQQLDGGRDGGDGGGGGGGGGGEGPPARRPISPSAAPPPTASPLQLLGEWGVAMMPAGAGQACGRGARLRAAVLGELVRLLRQKHAAEAAAWWQCRAPSLPLGVTSPVPR